MGFLKKLNNGDLKKYAVFIDFNDVHANIRFLNYHRVFHKVASLSQSTPLDKCLCKMFGATSEQVLCQQLPS